MLGSGVTLSHVPVTQIMDKLPVHFVLHKAKGKDALPVCLTSREGCRIGSAAVSTLLADQALLPGRAWRRFWQADGVAVQGIRDVPRHLLAGRLSQLAESLPSRVSRVRVLPKVEPDRRFGEARTIELDTNYLGEPKQQVHVTAGLQSFFTTLLARPFAAGLKKLECGWFIPPATAQVLLTSLPELERCSLCIEQPLVADADAAQQALPVLSQFPAGIQQLALSCETTYSAYMAVDAAGLAECSELKQLELSLGKQELLNPEALSACTALQHVTYGGAAGNQPHNSTDIIAALAGCINLKQLVCKWCMPAAAAQLLLSSLPALERCSLNITDGQEVPQALPVVLSRFPAGIQQLALICNSAFRPYAAVDAAGLAACSKLKQLHLGMAYQELRNVSALAACTALQHIKYTNGYEGEVYSYCDDPCYADIIAVAVKLPGPLLLELPQDGVHIGSKQWHQLARLGLGKRVDLVTRSMVLDGAGGAGSAGSREEQAALRALLERWLPGPARPILAVVWPYVAWREEWLSREVPALGLCPPEAQPAPAVTSVCCSGGLYAASRYNDKAAAEQQAAIGRLLPSVTLLDCGQPVGLAQSSHLLQGLRGHKQLQQLQLKLGWRQRQDAVWPAGVLSSIPRLQALQLVLASQPGGLPAVVEDAAQCAQLQQLLLELEVVSWDLPRTVSGAYLAQLATGACRSSLQRVLLHTTRAMSNLKELRLNNGRAARSQAVSFQGDARGAPAGRRLPCPARAGAGRAGAPQQPA